MIASRAIGLAMPAASPFLAYLRMEIRRASRNRRYLALTLVFPALIYVLYTAVLPVGGSQTVDGLSWPAYFMVSMAAYGAMGAALSQAAPIAIERRGGWIRQLRVTPLPGLAYVGAKVVSAVVLTVPALAIVTVAGSALNHVQLGSDRALLLVAALALGSVPFAALAVLIGYVLDADSAQGGMVLVYFPLAILGGLFAPLSAFPAPLATIGNVLPSSHFASLGRAVAAGRVPDLLDVLALGAWAGVLGGLAVWRYLRDERAGRG
ncbi:MAG TPA: ABC transporter permease [Candidatus Limnocylindrales bacterium]